MDDLQKQLEAFVQDRRWGIYHSPKNLSMAVATEAAEILEIFRWMSEGESFKLNEEQRAHLQDEIGDVMICLMNLASKFNIDVIEAAKQKLEKTESKYPLDDL